MVVRKNGKNLTTVYRKPTLSGQYVQRNSFCHDSRKVHVTKILILRALRICSPSLLELKLDFIKSVFLENGYSLEVLQTSIRALQLQQQKEPVFGPEKCPVYVKLRSLAWFQNGSEQRCKELYIMDITT